MSVANNIKSMLLKTVSVKEFMNFVEEHSQTIDKSLFDGSRTMHEHVIEMTNIAAKLKSLRMNVDGNFIYCPFQMNYNTMKDKWNVNELLSILVEEEMMLKNQGTHFINLEIKRQLDRKVKVVRSDKGNEYYGKYDETGQCPSPFLKRHGIYAQDIVLGIPQQNSVAERHNRTLLDMIMSMLSNSFLSLLLWMHALKTATYLLNRIPSKAIPRTSFKL
ncbi:hypothetical protein ACOSQ2_028776 [Xanthoceras sorbifolium]